MSRYTLKTNGWNPKVDVFVDVFPFPKGSILGFGGVVDTPQKFHMEI